MRNGGLVRWLTAPVNIIAAVLVVGGFLLAAIDWGFLALSVLGTFGPGLLRELGWLRDKDEFQLQTARRAGHHAYLVGGATLFLLVATFRSMSARGSAPSVDPGSLVEAVLVVMWFTWLVSSLLSFWGAQRMVRRILLIFGAVWLLFNLAAGEGDWMISLMQSLLAVPFFALAWAAPRWPRAAGLLLLAAAAFFFHLFGLVEIFSAPLELGRVLVLVLFVGPLVASGAALLGAPRDEAPA